MRCSSRRRRDSTCCPAASGCGRHRTAGRRRAPRPGARLQRPAAAASTLLIDTARGPRPQSAAVLTGRAARDGRALRRARLANRRLCAGQGPESQSRCQPLPRARQPDARRRLRGRAVSSASQRVTARFLDVTLEFAGEIPDDEYLRRSVTRSSARCWRRTRASPAARGIQETGRPCRYMAGTRRPARQHRVLRRAPGAPHATRPEAVS